MAATIGRLAAVWEARERRARRNRKARGIAEEGVGFIEVEVFELTRRMAAAGIGFDQEMYDGPLAAACGRLGLNVEDVFAALCQMLKLVETRPDTDSLAVAMRQADEVAHRFGRRDRSRAYARVAGLAWCLSRQALLGGWFPFGSERIAAWLGVTRQAVDRIVWSLDDDRVIALKRGQSGDVIYNHRTGEAREAKYFGPAL